MLEELMKIIRAGGTLETRSLALKLGVSPQLVQMMLEDLERRGKISSYSTCSDGCQGCSLKPDCSAAPHVGQPHLWQSTSKE